MKAIFEKFKKFLSATTASLLLLQALMLGFVPSVAYGAVPTTTIVGWNFPSTSADKYADSGIAANYSAGHKSELTEVGAINTSYISNGIDSGSDKAATAKNWDYSGESNSDYWQIEFSTVGYKTLSLSSKQRSDSDGPRDFHIDYSLNRGGSWTKVIGSDYQITNASWNNLGDLNNLILPSATDNQNSVTLRWHVASDHRASGNGDLGDGYNSIDNIFVNAAGVVDNTPPVIASHGDVFAQATSASGAVVTYANPSATDDVDSSVAVNCAPVSGSELGTHIWRFF